MSISGINKKIADLRYKSEEGFDNKDLSLLPYELADVEADTEEVLLELDAMYQYGGWDFDEDDIFDSEMQKQKNQMLKAKAMQFDEWQGYYPYYTGNRETVATGNINPAFVHKTTQETYVKPSKAEKIIGGFLVVKEG